MVTINFERWRQTLIGTNFGDITYVGDIDFDDWTFLLYRTELYICVFRLLIFYFFAQKNWSLNKLDKHSSSLFSIVHTFIDFRTF